MKVWKSESKICDIEPVVWAPAAQVWCVCMCEGGWRGAISSQPVNLSLDSFSPRLELSEKGGGNCQCTWSQASPPHTHTHTHTHVGFYGLRGLSIGIMVFILYKLYVLLPYTYPTPKHSPHRRRCIYIFPQKNSLCMIYKRFKLWGHWKCPHKSSSPCNTYVIPMSLYKFVSS